MRTENLLKEKFRPGNIYKTPEQTGNPRGRFLAYAIIRLTGVILAVLVLGHFIATHITTDVAETDAQFISQRWNSILWLVWDWAMLTAAMLHGIVGIWIIIEDYTPDLRKRRRRHRLLIIIGILLFTLGLITIANSIL